MDEFQRNAATHPRGIDEEIVQLDDVANDMCRREPDDPTIGKSNSSPVLVHRHVRKDKSIRIREKTEPVCLVGQR